MGQKKKITNQTTVISEEETLYDSSPLQEVAYNEFPFF